MNTTVLTKKFATLDMETINKRWDEISDHVAEAFRMTAEETRRFKEKDVARLIGSLPFIAGCEDAERTAVAHLGTYILSVKETKPYFNPHRGDNTDIFERLRLGMNFKGGDKAILEKGMSILALNMIDDYARDVHIDEALGKYNPVQDGAFDPAAVREELLKKIQAVKSPEIDTIIYGGVGTRGYWGFS